MYEFVDSFERLITTPHILTEVSNFLGQLKEPARSQCFHIFAQHVVLLADEYMPSVQSLAEKPEFVQFGITDTSVVEVAAEPYLVLTTDARLNAHLAQKGIASLNYNNFRPL